MYARRGLGFTSAGGTLTSVGSGAAAGSVAGPIGTAVGAVGGFLTSLFGGGVNKDPQRLATIDAAYAAAMAGDRNPYSRFSNLPGYEYLQLIATNPQEWGSQVAHRYAQIKLAEFKARVAAGEVGSVLVGQSNIPSTIGGTLQRVASNPLLIGALVVGGYFLLRPKRR